MVGQSWSFGAYAQAGHIIYNRLCVFPCLNIVCWVPYLVNNSKSSLNLHLPQSIESTLGIHVACLSPAKTRQHHAHPLWIKKEKKLWYIHGVHEILLIFCNPKPTAFTTRASNYSLVIVWLDNSRCVLQGNQEKWT